MSQKILVVEDNPSLLNTLYYNLSRQAYNVITVRDGFAALETSRKERPDLIILELMLPDLDGEEVCHILRQETIAPVLLLAAHTTGADEIIGFKIWADDYIIKPFSILDLLTRVKALLRRARYVRDELSSHQHHQITTKLELGDLVIDQMRCEVTRSNKPLRLKPKEYELLVFLALNQGIALSRDVILERVWGWDYKGDKRTVDVHVRWLREKIELDPAMPTPIATVRGVGYRFDVG